MKKKLTLMWLLGCLAVFALKHAHAGFLVNLDFDPNAQNVNLGDNVFVDLTVSGLSNGGSPSLGAFDFDVLFDDSILSFTTATFGNSLGDPNPAAFEAVTNVDTSVAGAIGLDETSLLFDLSFQADAFVLATLEFATLATGTSALTYANEVLSDENGSVLSNNTSTGSVTVNRAVVSAPDTLSLMGAFLLLGLLFSKRHAR